MILNLQKRYFKLVFMKNVIFLLLFSYVLLSCENIKLVTAVPTTDSTTSTTANEKKESNSTPDLDIQGHRGARGLMPENSIPGFLKALELGVVTLEMDIAITKDLKVVVNHDPYFASDYALKGDSAIPKDKERGFSNAIYKMNYADVLKYDIGSKGNSSFPLQVKMKVSPPQLADVFDACENYARKNNRPLPYYNLEIKSLKAFDNVYYPPVEQYVQLVMNEVQNKKLSNRVIIQSFDTRALKFMKEKYPQVKLAYNIYSDKKINLIEWLPNLGFTPTIISPNFQIVDEKLITDCKDKNIKVIPYTVNEVEDMKRLKSMGISGFMTDYPDRVKNL